FPIPRRVFSCMLAHRHSLLLLAIALSLVLPASATAAPMFDPTFGNKGRSIPTTEWDSAYMQFWDAESTSSGGQILVGEKTEFDRNWAMQVFRRNGQPDTRFGKNGNVSLPPSVHRFVDEQAAQDVLVQRNGSILVAGQANVFNSADRRRCRCQGTKHGWAVIKFLPSGRIDRRYGKNGIALLRGINLPIGSKWAIGGGDSSVFTILSDRRGGAVLYGNSTNAVSRKLSFDSLSAVTVRVDKSGRQDRRFGRGGRIVERGIDYKVNPSAMGVRRDGAILTIRESESRVRGRGWRYALIRRYNSAGRPLRGRGKNRPYQRVRVPYTGGDDYALFTSEIDDSGAIIFGPGDSRNIKSLKFMALAPNGKLDRRFGGDGTLQFSISRPDLGTVQRTAWVPSGKSGVQRVMIDFVGKNDVDEHRAVLSFNRHGRLRGFGDGSGLEVMDYGAMEIGINEIFMTVGKRTAYMVDSDVHVGLNDLNVVTKLKFDH
ncbi:MAG: hypothetical protein ACRDKE_12015, partial [Solirubrobacterales bacterium]